MRRIASLLLHRGPAPFALTSFKMTKLDWQLRVASGLIGFVFGVFLIYDLGFAQGGLFTESPSWDPAEHQCTQILPAFSSR
jgi:hypothetical protein